MAPASNPRACSTAERGRSMARAAFRPLRSRLLVGRFVGLAAGVAFAAIEGALVRHCRIASGEIVAVSARRRAMRRAGPWTAGSDLAEPCRRGGGPLGRRATTGACQEHPQFGLPTFQALASATKPPTMPA